MPSIPRTVVPAALATLAVAVCLLVPRAIPAGTCDPGAALGGLSREARFDATDAGLILRVEGRSPGIRGVLWAGRLPDGTLSTTQWVTGATTDPERQALEAALAQAVARLGDPAFGAGCPSLAVAEASPQAVEQRLHRALGPAPEASPAGASIRNGRPPLEDLIPYVVLGAIVLYLLLIGEASVRSLLRDPKAAALALGLFGLAVAVRFLAAPRLPMVAATADMTLVRLPVAWAMHGGFDWHGAGQPPGYAVFLSLVFRVLGTSFDVAFGTTTILGALVAIPIFRIASRLGEGRLSGTLAALAWAVLPWAVIFANGVNLETPSALLLAASFQHLLAWIDERRPTDVLRYALSVALFLHLRPEAPLQIALVATAQVGLVLAAGDLRRRLLSPELLGSLGIALLLVIPYGWTVSTWNRGHFNEAIAIAVEHVALGVIGIVGAGVLAGWADRRARAGAAAGRAILAAVVAVAVARLVSIAWVEGAGMLIPSFPETLAPRGAWAMGEFLRAYAPPHRIPIEDPRVFPPLFLLLGYASLPPSRGGRRDALGIHAPALLAALAVSLEFVGLAGSGENIGDSVRHHVPSAALAVVLVGLGATVLVRSLRSAGLPSLAAVLVPLVAVASPLATHRAVITDVDFNDQRRFAFVADNVHRVSPDALVLLADQRVRPETSERGEGDIVYRTSRTDHLFALLQELHGRPRAFEGFREWRHRDEPDAGPVVFFHDLDCYRTDDGREDPSCRAIREMPGVTVLAVTRFRNRPYTRYPSIDADDLEVSFLALPPDARSRLQDAPGGTTGGVD